MGNGRKRSTGGGDRMDVDHKNNGASTDTITCRKCKQTGHKLSGCPQKEVQCNFCQNTNHFGKDCFKNPKNAGFKGNASGTTGANVTNGTNGTTGTKTNTNTSSNATNGAQTNKNQQQQQQGFVQEHYTAYQGPQLWCPSCNSNTHSGDTCSYSKVHLSQSKMICLNCGIRGHTDADCRHPDPINCTVCHRASHKAAGCRSERAKWSALLGNNHQRFKWYENGEFRFQNLTEAQQRQFRLEHEIARIQRDELYGNNVEMINLDAVEQEYQNVAELSQIRWRNDQTEFLPIPLLHGKAMPTCTQSRSYRAPRPQGISGLLNSRFGNTRSGSSTASTVGDGNAKVNDWLNNGNTFKPQRSISTASNGSGNTTNTSSYGRSGLPPNHTMTPAEVREYYAVRQRMYEEQLTHTHKKVRAHIEQSYSRYRKQNYNQSIRNLGLRVIENRVLSEQRLLQVQMAMGQGWNFYRDPRAMEALARGLKCSCTTCGHEGVIHDGHMNAVDVAAAASDAEYFTRLEDCMDWGLFVVFQCACANKGYDWYSRTAPLLDVVEQPATPPSSAGDMMLLQ